MTNFASADEPTDQWVDDICPINPWGDQYQSPSGSSTGAAAALAGYPWLDHSIGADTGGIIRAPATANRLFSIRPPWNTTPMDGIGVICSDFDVVGIFGRKLQSIHDILSLTHNLQDGNKFPSKILYPNDFFPHSNKDQQAMVDAFITVLEKFLGVKSTKFSLAERWKQCPPTEATGSPIADYLANIYYSGYYHAYDEFRNNYGAKYNSDPYIGPVANFRWGIGKTVSKEDYHKGRDELRVFREWFDSNVLSRDLDTMSDAIMITPYGMGGPKYRDAANGAPSTSGTIVGQNPYVSRVSGNIEYRPIATTILGARGSDPMLLNLAKAALESVDWPTEVQTGRLMFELGDYLRNTAGGSSDISLGEKPLAQGKI